MKKGDEVVCTKNFKMEDRTIMFIEGEEYKIISTFNLDGYRHYVLVNLREEEHTMLTEDMNKHFRKK